MGTHIVMKHPGERMKNAVRTRIASVVADFRADGGFILVAPSRTYGNYEWVDGFQLDSRNLDVFDPQWIDQKEVKTLQVQDDTILRIVRARAYAAKVEGAISGQGGHNRTYRLACKLRRDFGLTVEQALPIMLEWDEKCQPKWSLNELIHKLQTVKL
jgi:hypothetical protein